MNYFMGFYFVDFFFHLFCFSTFANCCYKFLENPNVTRDKTLRDSIVDVIGILVKKYNHSLSVCVKVVQLLQHFEHLISPMAQLVQVCAMDYGVKSIVVEIMRYEKTNELTILYCFTLWR